MGCGCNGMRSLRGLGDATGYPVLTCASVGETDAAGNCMATDAKEQPFFDAATLVAADGVRWWKPDAAAFILARIATLPCLGSNPASGALPKQWVFNNSNSAQAPTTTDCKSEIAAAIASGMILVTGLGIGPISDFREFELLAVSPSDPAWSKPDQSTAMARLPGTLADPAAPDTAVPASTVAGMSTTTKGLIVAGAAVAGLGAIWAWSKYGKKHAVANRRRGHRR